MKIESIIQRADGTEVVLDKTTYRFTPEKQGGPHVCEVANERHVKMLLSIKEGYRPAARGNAAEAPSEPKKSDIMEPIILSEDEMDDDDIDGEDDLPPITIAEQEEAAGRAEMDADRAEYLAAMQRDNAARAADLQAFNDEAAGVNRPETDAVEVIEPEGAGEDDLLDDDSPTFTEAGLQAMGRDEVAKVYEAITGQKAKSNITKATLVKAILDNIGE